MPVPRRPPDLGALELLLAVVRLGSVGRAAAELGVTQPAASARIRSLERRLGMSLLERSPRGSRPTEAGALVAGWAQRVLDAAGDLDAGLAALTGRGGRGDELGGDVLDGETHVRVMACVSAAEHLMPGWLAALRESRPRTVVSLRTADSPTVAEQVRLGRADLGFVEAARTPAGLSGTVVTSDRLVVVVAPGHAWARRDDGVTAAELAAAPLLLRSDGAGTRAALDRALAAFGGTATPLRMLTSTPSLRAAAVAGAGPAVSGEAAVSGEIARGRLVVVPVRGLDLSRPLRAVWPAGRRPGGAAHALLAIVRRSRPRHVRDEERR